MYVAPMGIDHALRPANQRESAPPEIEVECICKDDKVSAALQMARRKLLSSDAFFFAFLRHFLFWMGIVKVVRWIGLKILIPKLMRKSQIRHLEQILGQKR